MNLFCQDRDLLVAEPAVFTLISWSAQRLAAGSTGVATGTLFDAAGAGFAAGGVQAGMVLCVHDGQVSEGSGYEIVQVNGDEQLEISVPRAGQDEAAISPLLKSGNLRWQVLTYRPQIAAVSAGLGERLRTLAESAGVGKAQFADSAQLRTAAVYGALSNIFFAAAVVASESDARWTKHRHYAGLFQKALQTLRLAVDVDGDGVAEQTRTLANVQLRRL